MNILLVTKNFNYVKKFRSYEKIKLDIFDYIYILKYVIL